MSRHRTEATELADRISFAARRAVGESVAEQLVSDGITAVRIAPFDPVAPASHALRNLKNEAEELIRVANIEDFQDADIVIQLAPRERISRCVAGSAVSARRFNIVDVRIKSTVRTRWVHPVSEAQFSRQWVIA